MRDVQDSSGKTTLIILYAMFVIYFTINHCTATSKSGFSANLYMP